MNKYIFHWIRCSSIFPNNAGLGVVGYLDGPGVSAGSTPPLVNRPGSPTVRCPAGFAHGPTVCTDSREKGKHLAMNSSRDSPQMWLVDMNLSQNDVHKVSPIKHPSACRPNGTAYGGRHSGAFALGGYQVHTFKGNTLVL